MPRHETESNCLLLRRDQPELHRPEDERRMTQKILEDLNSMFSQEWLRKIADETGLIKRERIIDPTIMFWALVLGFGVRLQRSLASLKRVYENKSGKSIRDSSWYY